MSLADRTVVGTLCLARKEGYVRVQTISALLHTSSFLPRVQVSAPKVHVVVSIPFHTWEGFLWMGRNVPHYNTPLKFPQGFAEPCPIWASLEQAGFVALMPDQRARPLATAHESVSTQTKGAFTTVHFFHHCWEDSMPFSPELLFLPSSIRVVAFLTGCCPFSVELPSTNQAALCWSVESYL